MWGGGGPHWESVPLWPPSSGRSPRREELLADSEEAPKTTAESQWGLHFWGHTGGLWEVLVIPRNPQE